MEYHAIKSQASHAFYDDENGGLLRPAPLDEPKTVRLLSPAVPQYHLQAFGEVAIMVAGLFGLGSRGFQRTQGFGYVLSLEEITNGVISLGCYSFTHY